MSVRFNHCCLAILSLVSFFTCGCSPSTTMSDAESSAKLESVVGQANGSLAQAATETELVVNEPVDSKDFTNPQNVVRDYLELLRRDQRAEAEKHLSQVAKINFLQSGLSMQSPGSADAEYQFALPRYATNQQRIAMIECQVNEKIDGKLETSTISWILRRDETIWRITGMVIDVDESGNPRLLSFENRDDVEFIKSHVFGERDAKLAEVGSN